MFRNLVIRAIEVLKKHILYVLFAALFVGVGFHVITLPYSPVHWIDDVAISEIARGGVGSRIEEWTLGWRGDEVTVRSWAIYWFGGWIHEQGYLLFGVNGPRIITLVFLVLLTILVYVYFCKKLGNKTWASVLSLLVFAFPALSQSVRGGRVDVIAFAWMFCALNVLRLLPQRGIWFILKYGLAGVFTVLAIFSWITAVMVVPVVMWEMYESLYESQSSMRGRIAAVFCAMAMGSVTVVVMLLPFMPELGKSISTFRRVAEMNLTDVNEISHPISGFVRRLFSVPFLYALGSLTLFLRKRFIILAIGVMLFATSCLLSWTYVFRMLYFLPYAIIGAGISINLCKSRKLRAFLQIAITVMCIYSYGRSILVRNTTEFFARRFRNYDKVEKELARIIGRDKTVYNDSNQIYYIGRTLNWKQYRVPYRSSISPAPILKKVDYFICDGVNVDHELDELLSGCGLRQIGTICKPELDNLSCVESFLAKKGRLLPLGPYCVYGRD